MKTLSTILSFTLGILFLMWGLFLTQRPDVALCAVIFSGVFFLIGLGIATDREGHADLNSTIHRTPVGAPPPAPAIKEPSFKEKVKKEEKRMKQHPMGNTLHEFTPPAKVARKTAKNK